MTQPTPPFDELTRELLMDHYRRPRHRGVLPEPALHFEGMNPVCGDEVHLDLRVEGERIADIAFAGSGCSISMASASMLADHVAGRSIPEARAALEAVRQLLMEHKTPEYDLGDIEVLEGVAKFPVRVKCALLSWNVLEGGLNEIAAARQPADQPLP